MKKQTGRESLSLNFGLVGIILFLVLGLIAVSISVPIALTHMKEDAKEGVSVSGDAELTAQSDEAYFSVTITTEDVESTQAQQQNADISANVKDALKKQGVDKEDIETQNYYLSQVYDYRKSPPQLKGYKVVNTLKISTKQLEKAGSFLDVAVQAGATSVGSINFDLSDEKSQDLREQALEKAVENAKEKAEAIADSVDMSLGDVIRVSESNVYFPVYRDYAVAEVAMGMAKELEETEIEPQEITVTASISLVYELK